jgi:hypothetical protein
VIPAVKVDGPHAQLNRPRPSGHDGTQNIPIRSVVAIELRFG